MPGVLSVLCGMQSSSRSDGLECLSNPPVQSLINPVVTPEPTVQNFVDREQVPNIDRSPQHYVSEIKTMLGFGFTVPEISRVTGLPLWRAKYLMRVNGLKSRDFIDISDDDLDSAVALLVQRFPNAGNKMIIGHARHQGLIVSRERLRRSFCKIKFLRQESPIRIIRRRCYVVKGPLSLWHIDGHHKLIRWGFIIHGGVDGYSRLTVFLQLSEDNRSNTVLGYFREAVAEWGLPVRVRSDHGLENVGVCDYMLAARASVDTPFRAGKSVHNQRIERLWRDVFESCLQPFYQTFYEMEMDGSLDPSNDLDIALLHLTCRMLLEGTVMDFKKGWNQHPLRTANSSSPLKLFYSGLDRLKRNGEQCHELDQDQQNITRGENEVNELNSLLSQREIASSRIVPSQYPIPVSKPELDMALFLMNPESVTLSNLKEKYCFLKHCISTIQRSA